MYNCRDQLAMCMLLSAQRHGGGKEKRRKGTPALRAFFHLQGEKPPLPEVPEEAAEHDGAADPCYGKGPLERVGHREQRDLEVHAEDPRDHAEDGPTNVAVVRSSSNWISWFRTLSSCMLIKSSVSSIYSFSEVNLLRV